MHIAAESEFGWLYGVNVCPDKGTAVEVGYRETSELAGFGSVLMSMWV